MGEIRNNVVGVDRELTVLDISDDQNADFPFLGRNPTPEELTALGGEYAAIADIAATSPLHAHFLAWGIYCRQGRPLFGEEELARAVSRDRPCGDCGQDRWVGQYCAVCGCCVMSLEEIEGSLEFD